MSLNKHKSKMEAVQLKLNEKNYGHFYIMEKRVQIGEMEISVSGNDLTVYHTEVIPEAEGKGVAKKLLSFMADYAKSRHLKVIPLCSYVYEQFKRHPETYADIWKK